MRVKKLNVNRRHKPGEDEAALGVAVDDGHSEQHKWVSPVKPRQDGPVASSTSGNNSPTDVQQQQQQLVNEHSPLQFQVTNHLGLFVDRGDPVMPYAASASDTHEEETTIHEHAIRSVMVDRIKDMLQAMKPHAPEKVLAALPRLAQHMEKSLFKQAKNEDEYCDPTTLRLRIAHIQENNAKRLLAQQQQTPEQNHNGKEATPVTEEQARLIFQYLQSWRQHLVNTYGVAPWDILPNSTLAKVALYMPLTEQELVVCGVGEDKIAQFGSSLVQEMQRLRGPSKAANRAKATQGRKPSHGKRGSPGSLAGGNRNKKRKDGEAARLGSAAPGSLLKSPAPLLPAVDSLPTLLPTVSMMPGGGTASTTATSSSMAMKQSSFSSAARLSPVQASNQPFFTRLQPQQQQGSSSPGQENHMHLLVQGAGQLSKQQHAKSLEAYEQEVQSLRWMLHQSQQEKTRLEQEVEHLRSELQQGRHRTT